MAISTPRLISIKNLAANLIWGHPAHALYNSRRITLMSRVFIAIISSSARGR